MGDNFYRFYVCVYNKWNPYDKEIMALPLHYWLLSYKMIQMNKKRTWDDFIEPHAELILQLTEPENFKKYNKMKKELREQEEKEEEMEGKEIKVDNTVVASANAYFDPTRGLVSKDGRLIIPKEEYQKLLGIDGIAIGY